MAQPEIEPGPSGIRPRHRPQASELEDTVAFHQANRSHELPAAKRMGLRLPSPKLGPFVYPGPNLGQTGQISMDPALHHPLDIELQSSGQFRRPHSGSVSATSSTSTSSFPLTSQDIPFTTQAHSPIQSPTPLDSDSESIMTVRRKRRDLKNKRSVESLPGLTNMIPSFTDSRRRNTSLAGSSGTSGEIVPLTEDDIEHAHRNGTESRGFFDLAPHDKRSFLLLCVLYFLQGAPMGFVGTAIPLLPEFRMDYSKVGILSLAMYPYSVKLLWSPIVDAVFNRNLGRRKSWILPVQMLSGLALLWLGSNIKSLIEDVHQGGGAGIWGFTSWWILLVFLCATQDIAVDGWAISLLSADNVSYASTAQTVGLTAGQFLCSTVFIPFSSPEFANKWFRTIPQDTGLITLGGALKATGWLYLIVTVGLAVFKREERTKGVISIKGMYKVMFGILKLKDVQTVMIVHLVAKIGFIANDAVTTLKLREKGMSQDDIALMMLIDFPFKLALGYYAGKWSQEITPMKLWSRSFIARLAVALFSQFVVAIFPSGGVPTWYLGLAILQNIIATLLSTTMFVAISAFHAQIADEAYGGTYMTLLATFSNMGGTFPMYFVLKSIDSFTSASCIPTPDATTDQRENLLLNTAMSCVMEGEKKACAAAGGMCHINRDGYNWVNLGCVLFSALLFWKWIRPTVKRLQSRPLHAWRLPSGSI